MCDTLRPRFLSLTHSFPLPSLSLAVIRTLLGQMC